MAGSAAKVVFTMLLTLAIIIPCLEAGIAEYDDFLKNQAEKAHAIALESYVPTPEFVASELNYHVHLAMQNSTRRGLRAPRNPAFGPCDSTNPIDNCWRCNKDWANDRYQLAKCGKGFGRRAVGGLGGPIYVVNDTSDDDMQNPKPGTIRHAVTQQGPLWITFSRSMRITLQQELMISSDKTIDGRGANVQFKDGGGLTMQFVNNIIIHGIRVKNIVPKDGGMIRDSYNHVGHRTRSDGDAISIFGASNIWIDHVSLSNSADGLIDVIEGSTAITVSNCHMTRHNDVMLFGASDTNPHVNDKLMQITVAFNHFGQGLSQRMPRCRFGFFHVLNNDYTHWQIYAIGGSSKPTILSQGNRFIAPNLDFAKEITHRDYATPEQWMQWQWQSDMDLLMNGATFNTTGAPIQMTYKKGLIMKPRDGTHVSRLTRHAGALNCYAGFPC
ncbi:pectate lyase-like [Vigna unguiculata]|uniref:pectate lyase-like n=1 Tax=Vigna unguiculata TaxID=3917 RepID=UPI0010162D1B|nr:pectate lyase-like [Vigna unguiculata]XP_027923941.1 pectate lyase-like [Vigna unguiculata]